mmetsp:Transcript_22800/g.63318  ORF Transcript_22800/g.63318 Transcript_22800/m.63318 type:complete len:213 (-) Transcript_22800:900-1538(-)
MHKGHLLARFNPSLTSLAALETPQRTYMIWGSGHPTCPSYLYIGHQIYICAFVTPSILTNGELISTKSAKEVVRQCSWPYVTGPHATEPLAKQPYNTFRLIDRDRLVYRPLCNGVLLQVCLNSSLQQVHLGVAKLHAQGPCSNLRPEGPKIACDNDACVCIRKYPFDMVCKARVPDRSILCHVCYRDIDPGRVPPILFSLPSIPEVHKLVSL